MKLTRLILGGVAAMLAATTAGAQQVSPQAPQYVGGTLAGVTETGRLTQPVAPVTPPGGQPQQWISAGGQGGEFPLPPVEGTSAKTPRPIAPSNNVAANYAVAGQPALQTQGAASQNGVAPMPPLAPPGNFDLADKVVAPFDNGEVLQLRQHLDDFRKAKAFRPVRTVPRITSLSVDLSPGATLPIARTLPGETTTLVFLDATGAPWPLAAAPRVSDTRYFHVEWLQGTPSVVISALSPYEDGNVTAFLAGLATPVVVKLSTGEPDSKETSRIVDYRLDLRVPGRGPNAHAPLMGPAKIALYDETLQAFLDGTPPSEARLVSAHGSVPPHTQVWQYAGALFVRTIDDIQSAFDQSVAAADGTRVYKLPPTPYITLSELGRSVTLELDIN